MAVTAMDAPTEMIINQRIRNRIIECLESAVSEDLDRTLGPDELVNLWYDFVPSWSDDAFPSPTYSDAEREGIRRVHDAFDLVVRSTSNPMPKLGSLKNDVAWKAVINAATAALAIFQCRGRLPEDGSATSEHS